MQCSLVDAEQHLKNSHNNYKKFKKQADAARITFLEDLAQAVADRDDKDKWKVYRQLRHREEQRSAGRRMRAALGKTIKGGIKRVEIISEDGTTMEIITKDGIEKACLEENEQKYCQTQQTPCMTNPLCQLLGLYGNSEFCENILNGTFHPPPHMNVYTTEFLQQLQQHPHVTSNISTTISPEDYSAGWEKMKEYTSSGGSGLHFGHMKACASSSFLTEFESSIAQIPFATGYSPSVWQQGVIVMIQKKAQVDLVSKLRTLVLTEADFNYNNKILGRRTLQHAETLALEHRKNHSYHYFI